MPSSRDERCVLVVNPDAGVRSLLSRALRTAEISVAAAGSIREAAAALQGLPVAAVLCDAALREDLSTLKRLSRAPILVMGEELDPETFGARVHVVLKPVDLGALTRTLRGLIHASQAGLSQAA